MERILEEKPELLTKAHEVVDAVVVSMWECLSAALDDGELDNIEQVLYTLMTRLYLHGYSDSAAAGCTELNPPVR